MWQVADPRPSFCSSCQRGADEDIRFFVPSTGAMFDGGSFARRDDLAYIAGSEILAICERCAEELIEATGYKPELDTEQKKEIRRLQLVADHYKDLAQRTADALQAANSEHPELTVRGGRKRRVAA